MKATHKFSALLACMALGSLSAKAATDPPAKPAAKHAAPAAKAAPAAVPALSAGQISTAERVLTGKVQCEFDQAVDIAPVSGKSGYFSVGFKGKTYTMVPEATTTGAIRLEDKKNGMMWLQIANKSMLMNSKAGQRMVDNCQHPSQKT
jgi:hypothetical protein